MKHTILMLLAAALLAAAGGGCASATAKTTPAFEGQKAPEGYAAVVNGEFSNCGYYLFYFIPIITGNDSRPNERSYDMFCDQVKPRQNYRIMRRAFERYDVDDVCSVETTEHSVGFFSLWIVWFRRCETTATGLKRLPPPEPDEEEYEEGEEGEEGEEANEAAEA